MSAVQIELNRVHISTRGVSAHIVQEALDGLEEALSRRLQGMKADYGKVVVNGIRLDPQQVSSHIKAVEMRSLLVEQIVAAIEQAGRGGHTE